jgi:MFS family permease
MPLYMVEHGIDAALLGVIIAAWPLAQLIAEPVFGYLADRRARPPLMLAGLLLLAVGILLPVWITGAPAFIVARLLSGTAIGMYDPAARGIIVDSTPDDRRGEAFGLYGAFRMGGLVMGPLVGAIAASVVGGFIFPFILTAMLILGSTVYLWINLRDVRDQSGPVVVAASSVPPATPATHQAPWAGNPSDSSVPSTRPTHLVPGGDEVTTSLVGDAVLSAASTPAPTRGRWREFRHPMLLTALVLQATLTGATGIYEVIWSLYLERLGASVAWIGLTFTLFGLPVMLLSPVAGRLVDRVGGLRFAIGGSLVLAGSGLAYTLATEPVLPAVIGLVEASGFAFINPALYWLLARGTPRGRTSTAQGIFGAVGTLGMIASALAAGILWGIDPHWPFYFLVVVALTGVTLAALAARRAGGSAARTMDPLPADSAP